MVNFFKMFKINEAVNIDADELTDKYFDLRSKAYDDEDDELAAQINDGYSVLNGFFSRVCHILSVNGFSIDEIKLDDDFLNEVMDLSEMMMDNNADALAKIKEEYAKEINLIAEAFENNDYKKMSVSVAKLRYFGRLSNDSHEDMYKYYLKLIRENNE